jgi:hypothetical protein
MSQCRHHKNYLLSSIPVVLPCERAEGSLSCGESPESLSRGSRANGLDARHTKDCRCRKLKITQMMIDGSSRTTTCAKNKKDPVRWRSNVPGIFIVLESPCGGFWGAVRGGGGTICATILGRFDFPSSCAVVAPTIESTR